MSQPSVSLSGRDEEGRKGEKGWGERQKGNREVAIVRKINREEVTEG